MNEQKDLSQAAALSLLLVACLTIMVGCVIVPGLPAIARELGVSDAASWLVTIPSLGVVLFGPIAGRLIPAAGLYRSLCVGLFFYGLLGAGGALLHGLVPVFVDRLLLGGATAVVMSAGTGLISAFYEGDARLRMIAYQGMSIELGGVVFLSLGGLLAGLAWFWPFALYLFAWLMLGMVWCFVPRPLQPSDAVDTLPSQRLGRDLKRIYAAACASMTVFFIGIIVLPYRLHDLGLDESETGNFLSFVSLVAVAAAALMPRIAKRLGEYATLLIAFVLYASAHTLFSVVGTLGPMIAGGVLMGCGFGLSVPLVNHMTVVQSHANLRARNLAYLSMALFTGQFLSAFTEFLPGSNRPIFAAGAALAFVAGVTVWNDHRTRRHEPTPGET